MSREKSTANTRAPSVAASKVAEFFQPAIGATAKLATSTSVMPAPKKKEEELEKFWFPNDAEGYVLGEVLHKDESDNMHVKLHLPDGETKTSNFHATVAKPPNPKLLDGVHDNTQLMHLHEPSLLYNIRFRYGKDQIYTYTGSILIALRNDTARSL